MARDPAIVEEELAEVRAAIRAVLRGGQANAIHHRALTRASLRDLRDMQKELEAELTRLQRGGVRVRRGVPLG